MTTFLTVLVATVAYLGYRLQSLSVGGAITAFVVGVGILISFGYEGLLVLAIFFVSSTLLGRVPTRKFKREHEVRTVGQVFANGGVATLAALSSLLFVDDELAMILFISAFAAANSDTWATEGGRRWGGRPYHLRKRGRASIGRSGAITVVGTLFSFVGSALIALSGSILMLDGEWALLMTLAGFTGALADTLIGAFIQEERKCIHCQSMTEEKRHCGSKTKISRGVLGIDNNIVNTVSTMVAPLLSLFIFLLV
ncbi:uncharacterized protein (TIGR00297 family) [Geomicrobium halophilum]|uniref:Uncharacterized protein (TIGR00297 family) n=1 Tax=Geomicrobium halophilum TaxID=549000 RepID=A0A841PWX7_9BACL|nr:DUF92 domain-containing protein [Geomicrobium halophilum]MBB6448873.1 uncharacterized protein (TIGR00297 family) [Geomicrobium halophilum]